jgi:hypothetical protein
MKRRAMSTLLEYLVERRLPSYTFSQPCTVTIQLGERNQSSYRIEIRDKKTRKVVWDLDFPQHLVQQIFHEYIEGQLRTLGVNTDGYEPLASVEKELASFPKERYTRDEEFDPSATPVERPVLDMDARRPLTRRSRPVAQTGPVSATWGTIQRGQTFTLRPNGDDGVLLDDLFESPTVAPDQVTTPNATETADIGRPDAPSDGPQLPQNGLVDLIRANRTRLAAASRGELVFDAPAGLGRPLNTVIGPRAIAIRQLDGNIYEWRWFADNRRFTIQVE